MSLNDSNIKELVLSQFRGSDNTSDDYNIDPAHLLNAQNLDYTVAENGMVQAGSRTGTAIALGTAANPIGAIPSLASWLFVTGGVQTGYLAYLTFTSGNPDIVFLSQNSSTIPTSIVVPTGTTTVAANFAIDGLRFFFALQSAVIGGPGTSGGQVYGVTPNAFEPLFTGATTATMNPAVGGAISGTLTQGLHRIGYIFTTLNGYTGVLNPVTSTSSNVWNFATFTAPDGTRNVTANIGPFTGSFSGQTVQVVMTTAANVNTVYAVPGATATLSGASPTVHIVVSITDSDLVATGTNVTQNQNLLAATSGGTAPFSPSALFIYSSRMGYCTYDSSGAPVVYFSDQNNYQSLTAAFHGVYLEGRQVPIQGTSLGGVCYIVTLSGLYATQDNGGLPSTWIPPSRVDGSVGVLSSTCICASTQALGTATGRIIMAAEKGLFIFKGGTFPEIPLSYWQTTDWNRINWSTPYQVQVVDDVYRQKIRVLAPLKSFVIGATNTNPIVITTSPVQASSTSNPLPGPHLIPSASSIVQVGTTATAQGAATATTAGFTTTGATLLVITVAGDADITTATVSDSNGNTWHSRQDQTSAGALNCGMWYAFDKSGGALVTGAGHTATVTLTNVGFTFSAFSGTLAGHVDPYDSTAGQSGATASGVLNVQPGSITAAAGSLVVTAFGANAGAGNASSISSPYIIGGSIAASGSVKGSAIGFSTNVTTTNPTWTATGFVAAFPTATIASFKAANANQGTMQVTITGVLGNTNANGTFTPTVLSPTTFSIPVAGNGAYTGAGIVAPASQNAEMTWNYPVGDEPGQPFYSLNSWTSYPPNSIGIVRNIVTEIDETWYGPATPGKLLRRVVPSDASQYRDQDLSGQSVPIPAVLESVLIPGTSDTSRNIHDYHGAHFRISGGGAVSVTAFSLDHSLSVVPAASPLALNLTPGQEVLMKWFLRNEQQSIQLSLNTTDAFFILARIKAYYTDSVPMR